MGGGPENPIIADDEHGDINPLKDQMEAITLTSDTKPTTAPLVDASWGDTDDEDLPYTAEDDSESDDSGLYEDSDMNYDMNDMEEQRTQEVRQEVKDMWTEAGKPNFFDRPDYTKELAEPSWGDDEEDDENVEEFDEEDGDDDESEDSEVLDEDMKMELQEELRDLKQNGP